MLSQYHHGGTGYPRTWVGRRYSPTLGVNVNRQVMADLLHQVVRVASGNTLFTTETGYFGIAGSNDALMKGDFVAVLWGCSLPVVLRPLADGVCSLMTFAYVDGTMNGELFKSGAQSKA